MIDPELAAKLEEISAKADRAYHSAEAARKYLFWSGIISVALILLPIIGIAVAIPQFIGPYSSTLNSIGY